MGEHERQGGKDWQFSHCGTHVQLMNVCDGARLSLGKQQSVAQKNDNEYRGLVNDLRRVVLQGGTPKRQTALDETGSVVTCSCSALADLGQSSESDHVDP